MMATEAILADIGALYKRLFNHRPLVQNEVHYFVKEFETKLEDADWKSLRDSQCKADEIHSVFLNEMDCSNSQFKTILDKAQTVQNLCESILSRPEPALELTQEERDTVEKEVEELSGELKLKEWDICVAGDQEIVRLKEEIQEVRGTRAKMRSIGSSASSSVTIFPSGTPGSSPEEELVDSSPEEELTSPEEDLEQDKSNKEAKGAHWEEEKKGKEESCVNNLPQKDS